MSWMNTRHCCSGVFLNDHRVEEELQLALPRLEPFLLGASITTGPVRLRSASSLPLRIMRS